MVQRVVADTSPINYLILIGHIELLPVLFAEVAVPRLVAIELGHADAPEPVRQWISQPPGWLEIHAIAARAAERGLDEAEAAAISLAESLRAGLLLMDERAGVRVGRQRGLRVTGTLGLLDLAAQRGMIDFAAAVRKLEATSFRLPAALVADLRSRHAH